MYEINVPWSEDSILVKVTNIRGRNYECIGDPKCPNKATNQHEIERKIYCLCDDHDDIDFVTDLFLEDTEADIYHFQEMKCRLD